MYIDKRSRNPNYPVLLIQLMGYVHTGTVLAGLAISVVDAEKQNFIKWNPRTCYDGKGDKPFMFEVLPVFG